jgi:hypothetical protein
VSIADTLTVTFPPKSGKLALYEIEPEVPVTFVAEVINKNSLSSSQLDNNNPAATAIPAQARTLRDREVINMCYPHYSASRRRDSVYEIA